MSTNSLSLTPDIPHLSKVESQNVVARESPAHHQPANKINHVSVETILAKECEKTDTAVHTTSTRPGGVPIAVTSEGHKDSCLSSVLDDKNIEGNKDVKGNFDLPELHLNSNENPIDNKILTEAKQLLENGLDGQFEILLKNLDKKTASNVVIHLLNHYAKDSNGSGKYESVMQTTLKAFPDVSKLFETTIAGRTLSAEGIDLVFQHLTEKGSLQMEALTANGTGQLDVLLQQLPEMPDGKYGVAFCLLPPHFTPILFEKVDGQVNVVMTDSLGKTTNVQMLGQYIKTQLKGADLFIYTQKRQITHTNCRIFTIRDLVHMSKNADFTSFVKNNVSEEGANGMKFFDRLPPEMLKVTQTRQILTESDKESQISRNPTKKAETLAESLDRHSIEVERERGGELLKSKFNLLIENRFKKYEKIIIAKTISEGIEKES